MMGFLPVTAEIAAEIAAMVERARANPVTWEQAKPCAVPFATEMTLEARQGMPAILASEQIVLGSFRCAFSVEEQPAGMCWHLSVSVATPGETPSVEAMQAILELFGMDQIGPKVGVWLEEFEPGHHAVNVVQLKFPNEAGHA